MDDLGDETLLTKNAIVPSLMDEKQNYQQVIDILIKFIKLI